MNDRREPRKKKLRFKFEVVFKGLGIHKVNFKCATV